jgi:hypothetical protein
MRKPHAAGDARGATGLSATAVDLTVDVRGTDEQVGTGAQHDFSSVIQGAARFRLRGSLTSRIIHFVD